MRREGKLDTNLIGTIPYGQRDIEGQNLLSKALAYIQQWTIRTEKNRALQDEWMNANYENKK